MIIRNGDADKFEKHNVQLEDYFGDGAEETDFLRVESEIGHLQEFYVEEGTFIYYVVSGEGTFYLDGEPKEVEEKDLVVAPPETKIYYLGEMELILVCTPPYEPDNEVHIRYLDENGQTISKEERERKYGKNKGESHQG